VLAEETHLYSVSNIIMHSSQTECLIFFAAAQLHVDLGVIGRCGPALYRTAAFTDSSDSAS
jgi:hypothetical protein